MRRLWKIMVALLTGSIILGAVLAGPIMSDVEHPKYTVISANKQKGIEIKDL